MKEPFFSITARDCEWSYTRGTGAGGKNVETVFYDYINLDNDLTSGINFSLNEVKAQSSGVKNHKWYTFNAQQAHGIKNLTGTRLILSIVFKSNITFSLFKIKYQHLLR